MLQKFQQLRDRFALSSQAEPPTTEVIARAARWQQRLRWMAWVVPVLISIIVYMLVWYRLILPNQSTGELQQASNIIFLAAIASLVVGIFIYQVQIILAQQVATSEELERKVEERTRHITDVMQKLDEQNQALRLLDKQKSEFVALVSHELRAPLTNINGGLELLFARDKQLSSNSRSTLDLVAAEAARLTHFVETILNVSAMESGQLPAQPGPVNVEAVIRHVAGQFSQTPASQLVLAIPPDLPPVLADEHFLQSVVFHLVDNALKYAPESTITILATTREGWVEIRVRDRGIGVSPQAAKRLFHMFERLDARDSQSVYGYGLGLYMCKQLMRAMQGEIWLDEAETPGATFVVDILTWRDQVLPDSEAV
jgi:signal transduction histidine kinase